MCDAPELLWLWPAEPEDGVDKFVSFPGQPYPSGSTTYIRADLSDALLREAKAVLAKAQDQSCEGFCEQLPQADTYTPDMDLDCATCFLRPTLAKLRAHLEGEKE